MNQRKLAVGLLLATTCLTSHARGQSMDAASAVVQVTQAPPPPTAQGGVHENILEEVIVTSARKREEAVQSVPVAVTALNADILERNHVTDLMHLGGLSPNVQVERGPDTPDTVNITMRGFGIDTGDPSNDPAVAVFVDGIYTPAASGTLIDTFDVSSLEILRGAQGTLVGKNAPVGAITITSKRPTGDFDGEVQFDYQRFDQFEGRARVDFPILQDDTGRSILAGHAYLTEREGGNYVTNTVAGKTDMGGENIKAGRLGLLFTPTDNFEWYLVGDVLLNRSPQPSNRLISSEPPIPPLQAGLGPGLPYGACLVGSCAPTAYDTSAASFTDRPYTDQGHISSTITYRTTPVTLTAVTGFQNYWSVNNEDIGGSQAIVLNVYHDKTELDDESQEIRLSSNKNGGWDLDGRLDWVAGASYYHEQYNQTQTVGVIFPIVPDQTTNTEEGTSDSEAVFLHADYHFTDEWTGTFGVRQTWDQKTYDYTPSASYPQVVAGLIPKFYNIPAGFHNTSFEVGTSYQFTPEKMAYIRFAQGYKGGGYVGFPAVAPGGGIFGPETDNDYELGVKTDWLDKHLRVNLNFFLTEFSALQVSGTSAIPNPPFFETLTQNAASATIKGMELETTYLPTDNLTTFLNVGYLQAKYDKFSTDLNGAIDVNGQPIVTDNSGFPFGRAPHWTIRLGADYVYDLPNDWGSLTLSGDWNYRTKEVETTPIPYPAAYIGDIALLNAGVEYDDPSGKYSVRFYGQNILNRKYPTEVNDPGGLMLFQSDARPAIYGITLSYKFGPY